MHDGHAPPGGAQTSTSGVKEFLGLAVSCGEKKAGRCRKKLFSPHRENLPHASCWLKNFLEQTASAAREVSIFEPTTIPQHRLRKVLCPVLTVHTPL